NPWTFAERCRVRALAARELPRAEADCAVALQRAKLTLRSAALTARAIIRFRQQKYAEAIADCDEALTFTRWLRNAETLYIRGLAKRGTGDTAGADADIAAAKALDARAIGRLARHIS